MKTFTKLFLSVALSLFMLTSCHKECDEKGVITKNNLPLSGRQEVPARETKASGTLNVSYNKRTKILTYEVTWAYLSGIPVGAHIHGEAPKGKNAGIKHDFADLIPKTSSGTYKGTVKVDEVAIKEAGLLAGLYYVNLHTPMFQSGEIRGQIEF